MDGLRFQHKCVIHRADLHGLGVVQGSQRSDVMRWRFQHRLEHGTRDDLAICVVQMRRDLTLKAVGSGAADVGENWALGLLISTQK